MLSLLDLLQCSDSKFKCVTSGYCIEQNLKCDGKLNCLDGSDEVNCPTSMSSELYEFNNV